MLSGEIRSFDDLDPGDYRRNSPRFQGENFAKNISLVDKVKEIATEKGCTSSQLALAWVMAQGQDIVAIPGTKRRKYLDENLGAAAIILSAADLERLDQACPKGSTAGTRYPAASMGVVHR